MVISDFSCSIPAYHILFYRDLLPSFPWEAPQNPFSGTWSWTRGYEKEGNPSNPESRSAPVVVGNFHNHEGKQNEGGGSQPFISARVFGVEVTNVTDGNSGDDPGEHQGNFSEAEEQILVDDRDDGEDVTGSDGNQGVCLKMSYIFLEPGAWVIIFTASTISGNISAGNPMTISSSAIPENLLDPSQPSEKFGLPVR